LNSDSLGTLTAHATNGAIIHNGTNPDEWNPSGAVAVLLAPGEVLRRQGASSDQDRTCAGGSCDPNGKCITTPPTDTPKCNPQNYLDTAGEDNAAFGDNTLDGFIQGGVIDTNGEVIVNDRLLAITYQDLMPLLERRVAGEVLACLRDYSALLGNNARYPWAANVAWPDPPILSDARDLRFGRVPDEPFSNTKTDIGGPTSDTWLPDKCKPPKLATCTVPVQCKITSRSSSKTWWLNWKEHVFYAVAEAYQPATGSPSPCGLPNSCLTVNSPSPTSDRRAVVMVAGKKLAAALNQVRDNAAQKGIPTNYLEGENADDPPGTYDNSYTSGPATATFNDITCNNGNCL